MSEFARRVVGASVFLTVIFWDVGATWRTWAANASQILGHALTSDRVDTIQLHDDQLAAIARTESLLAARYAERTMQARRQLRATYKLVRNGWGALLVDAGKRQQETHQRALVHEILARSANELSVLQREIELAAQAKHALLQAKTTIAASSTASKTHGQLRQGLGSPVDSAEIITAFGIVRHRPSGAKLSHRGVELSVAAGEPVRAIANGTVLYAGPLHRLDNAVVVAHEHTVSVITGLGMLACRTGQTVARTDLLGRAKGASVYFELRQRSGLVGVPINPTSILTSPARESDQWSDPESRPRTAVEKAP